MFDANCIRERLLDYEIKGLDYIHKKNLKIDELFYELNYISERLFIDVKKKEDKEKEKEKEQTERNPSFFSFIKEKPKKQEETQIKNEPAHHLDKKKLKEELNSILSEQCVLCGDYIVDSVQCSICKPSKLDLLDGYEFEIKGYSDWDYKKEIKE